MQDFCYEAVSEVIKRYIKKPLLNPRNACDIAKELRVLEEVAGACLEMPLASKLGMRLDQADQECRSGLEGRRKRRRR